VDEIPVQVRKKKNWSEIAGFNLPSQSGGNPIQAIAFKGNKPETHGQDQEGKEDSNFCLPIVPQTNS
jgi:hypothetical protein